LKQLCNDSRRIAENEINSDENKVWAEKIKRLSENVETKIKSFDPAFDEETNLLHIYEDFEDELKQFFIEEFIFDSDKQIEYDIIEKMNGIDFEEKIKLTQMYKTAADLVELFREKMDKAA
jgi:hypothetical protein